jgi:hypothetical protein
MPFFEYSQKNPGGAFDVDHKRGISRIVIIEADSADEANRKAEGIGLYFDEEDGCSTCGERWYEVSDRDAESVPCHYGEPIQDVIWDGTHDYKWIRGGAEAYVHFKDGLIRGYGLPQKQL